MRRTRVFATRKKKKKKEEKIATQGVGLFTCAQTLNLEAGNFCFYHSNFGKRIIDWQRNGERRIYVIRLLTREITLNTIRKQLRYLARTPRVKNGRTHHQFYVTWSSRWWWKHRCAPNCWRVFQRVFDFWIVEFWNFFLFRKEEETRRLGLNLSKLSEHFYMHDLHGRRKMRTRDRREARNAKARKDRFYRFS